MGEPKTPHFYNFGISERVPGSQNQYYLSLETPGHLNKSTKNQTFESTICMIFNFVDFKN